MAKTFRIQKQKKVVDKIKHGYIKYCYRAAFSEDKLFSAVSKGHLKKYFKVFLIRSASWLSHVYSWPCLYNLHFSNARMHVSCVKAPSTSKPTPSACMLSFCNSLSVMGFKIILISQTLKDPTIIGSYDTIAVYADNDAVEFFKRSGFTDDVVLCSRFR